MGRIRVGIGGWTFPPWRGSFYPPGLTQARELHFASRAFSAIEINGTYYSTFRPGTFRSWAKQTPDDFMFTVKAARACTNRRILGEAGPAIQRFIGQGLAELGDKLGPVNWQFMATKKFDATDFARFLDLLPQSAGGIKLRHALEVRHVSFQCEAFTQMVAERGFAVVWALGDVPEFTPAAAAPFAYARFMISRADLPGGITPDAARPLARRLRQLARRMDVFAFLISAAKDKTPAAAKVLAAELEPTPPPEVGRRGPSRARLSPHS